MCGRPSLLAAVHSVREVWCNDSCAVDATKCLKAPDPAQIVHVLVGDAHLRGHCAVLLERKDGNGIIVFIYFVINFAT